MISFQNFKLKKLEFKKTSAILHHVFKMFYKLHLESINVTTKFKFQNYGFFPG